MIKSALLTPATALTTVLVFHDRFLSRIANLDIMDASSVMTAHHLAEDGVTKVPANKILEVSDKLLDKMIDVQVSESPFVGQVLPLLQQADAGLKAQIADYRQKGDLSDESDPGFAGMSDLAIADQALDRNRANGDGRHKTTA